MLGRRPSSAKLGSLVATGLEPFAQHFAVDHPDWMWVPPRDDSLRVLGALDVGATLLVAFGDPDSWQFTKARLARRAAGWVRDAFGTDRGCDAIAVLTRGYA